MTKLAEGRILIQKVEPKCKFREKNIDTIAGEKMVWFKCCKFNKRTTCEEDDFIHCEKKELIGLSLQEAIRKMCDAYFKAKDKGAMESERVVAALNALLDTPTLEERVEEICKNNAGIADYDAFYKALREGK